MDPEPPIKWKGRERDPPGVVVLFLMCYNGWQPEGLKVSPQLG